MWKQSGKHFLEDRTNKKPDDITGFMYKQNIL